MGAEPEPLKPGDSSAFRVSRETAEQELAAESVTAYAKAAGVSLERARRSMVIQRQAPDLATVLRERVGSGMTQMHFDNSASEFVILIDSSTRSYEASQRSVADAMKQVALSDSYRVVPVPFSRTEMSILHDRLSDALLGHLPVIVEERAGGLYVVSTQADATPKVRSEVRAIVGNSLVPVEVVEDVTGPPAPALLCAHPNCDRIVGGIRWILNSGSSCTAGFYAGSPGTPHPLILTAGHCTVGSDWVAAFVQEPGTWYWTQIGSQIPFHYYDAGGDAGLVQVTNGRPAHGGYINWSTNGYSQLEATISSPPPIGYVGCRHSGRKYGAAQGDACAEVAAQDSDHEHLNGPRIYGLIRTREGMCAKQGDSGGPVTWANDEWAWGLLIGGNDTSSESPGCGTMTWIEPIYRAQSRLGIVIYGGPAY